MNKVNSFYRKMNKSKIKIHSFKIALKNKLIL